MGSLAILVSCCAVLSLQGCGSSFHYTQHTLRVVDKVTNAPIPAATLEVSYAVVPCGGPFAFLGAPDMPSTSDSTTDQNGFATLPLELEWHWGLTIHFTAMGYVPGEFERGFRDTREPPVPSTFALKRDVAP